MNARDFTPIKHPSPLAHPPVKQVLAAHLVLEPARAAPCHEGADDTAEYAAQMRVRLAINDSDVANALDRLFDLGELPAELNERIDELAHEFCARRLEEAGRDA